MGGNSDNFCIFLSTLETIFHDKKTFRLVRGSLSWSETPYFHKGEPLRMVPKLPLGAKMKLKTHSCALALRGNFGPIRKGPPL